MAMLSVADLAGALGVDPALYPHQIDLVSQRVLIVRLSPLTLRTASFLDDRILTPDLDGCWVSFADFAAMAPPPQQRPLHFIFHAGHVGSTLITRVLDEITTVLCLREPLPLRTLAGALEDLAAPHSLVSAVQWRTLAGWMFACWRRGFAQTQTVIVKATSGASPCLTPCLDLLPDARALHLSLRPEPYLATLLAGPNSAQDLRGQAQARMRRLTRQVGRPLEPLHALTPGEIAAMTWAVETLTRRAAEARFPDRVLPVDFDDFLKAPEQAVAAICTHFAIAAPHAYLTGLHDHPAFTRYSKAPEHAYSPSVRQEVLAASRIDNAGEIARGLAWIEMLGAREPSIGALLSS